MEAPTPPSQLRRWSPLWTSLTAVGLYVVALVAITSVALDDQVFDFARDLSAAGPALLLVGAALWLWPRPQGRLGRLARTVVLVGLALWTSPLRQDTSVEWRMSAWKTDSKGTGAVHRRVQA